MSKIGRSIQNFVSAVGEMQRAKKNIKRLKPIIAQRKNQVATIRLTSGREQPKGWGGSNKYFRD